MTQKIDTSHALSISKEQEPHAGHSDTMTILTKTGLQMQSPMEMITISNYLEAWQLSKITKLLFRSGLVRRSHSNHVSVSTPQSPLLCGDVAVSVCSSKKCFLSHPSKSPQVPQRRGQVPGARRRGGCTALDSEGRVRCPSPDWPRWLPLTRPCPGKDSLLWKPVHG